MKILTSYHVQFSSCIAVNIHVLVVFLRKITINNNSFLKMFTLPLYNSGTDDV